MNEENQQLITMPQTVRAINAADVDKARERMDASIDALRGYNAVGAVNIEAALIDVKRAKYALKDSTDKRRATDRMLDAALDECVPGLAQARALSATERALNGEIVRVDEMCKDYSDPHRHDVFAYMLDVRATVAQFTAITKAIAKAGAQYVVTDSTIGQNAGESKISAPAL